MINEFIGDAILVLFGAPVRGEDDPAPARSWPATSAASSA